MLYITCCHLTRKVTTPDPKNIGFFTRIGGWGVLQPANQCLEQIISPDCLASFVYLYGDCFSVINEPKINIYILGGEFKGVTSQLMVALGVKIINSSPYAPHVQGKLCTDQISWFLQVSYVRKLISVEIIGMFFNVNPL